MDILDTSWLYHNPKTENCLDRRKNLAFPDILSRNVTTRDLDKHQLKHNKYPKDILFYDKNGYEEKYFIVHDTKKGPSDELFPVIKQNKNGVTRFKINNDILIKIPKETKKEQICSLTDISSYIIQGSAINQVRMIQNKIPNNNASDEESDHNYSELSFELNTNPTQLNTKIVETSEYLSKVILVCKCFVRQFDCNFFVFQFIG